jgi:hypothetical protein
MRVSGSLFAFVLVAGCVGRGGPVLPPNVGTDHPAREEQRAAATPPVPAEPVEIGTPVWANFHDSGFYFHAVVVERREAMHRVLYADGASEWLPAESLLPDALREDAHVHVRPSFGEEFQEAVVSRRLGQAVYVRMAGGDERWTALPHVRFRDREQGIPARGDAPVTMTADPGQPGAAVLVDYQLQGLRFPGTITARHDDGRVHVVYLDGESEWAYAATAAPDRADVGMVVHVRRSWEPPVWVRGRIQRRMGSALAVELDDGGIAWTSTLRIRVPVEDGSPRPAPTAPEPEAEPAPEPAPRRGGGAR